MRIAGSFGVGGVEGGFEAVRVGLRQLDLVKVVVDRGQHDLGGERQRTHHRPGRDGAVVGSVWHASSQVTEELALDAAYFDRIGSGTVARCDSPTPRAIARELERIVYRVSLLHIGSATAVLEVVDSFGAHEGVLNAAKVYPDMRELVGEQRSGVQVFLFVRSFPTVGRRPGGIGALGKRMRGRAQPQDIQQHRLVVAFPTVLKEPALGLPAVGDRWTMVLRPSPIGAPIEPAGETADLALVRRVHVKIDSGRQRSRQQKSAVHR